MDCVVFALITLICMGLLLLRAGVFGLIAQPGSPGKVDRPLASQDRRCLGYRAPPHVCWRRNADVRVAPPRHTRDGADNDRREQGGQHEGTERMDWERAVGRLVPGWTGCGVRRHVLQLRLGAGEGAQDRRARRDERPGGIVGLVNKYFAEATAQMYNEQGGIEIDRKSTRSRSSASMIRTIPSSPSPARSA